MMDDRDEHPAHSSVGGIYRLNRTVRTCLCHLLECMCAYSLARIFPPSSEMSSRHGYARIFCSLFSCTLEHFFVSLSWYMTCTPFHARSICSCLLFPLGLRCVRGKHGAAQGFRIDFCRGRVHNVFIIIILCNIIDPRIDVGALRRERSFELESHCGIKNSPSEETMTLSFLSSSHNRHKNTEQSPDSVNMNSRRSWKGEKFPKAPSHNKWGEKKGSCGRSYSLTHARGFQELMRGGHLSPPLTNYCAKPASF